jgi:hypothetical protein
MGLRGPDRSDHVDCARRSPRAAILVNSTDDLLCYVQVCSRSSRVRLRCDLWRLCFHPVSFQEVLACNSVRLVYRLIRLLRHQVQRVEVNQPTPRQGHDQDTGAGKDS